jgi:YgiT-type zinc finger domain-containing protein
MSDAQTNDYADSVAPCPECQTGLLRLNYLTYFTWLNEELVTVPNFPAWVCDVCGRREYDPRAIKWLNTLLNPETGRKRPRYRREFPRPSRPQRPNRLQP